MIRCYLYSYINYVCIFNTNSSVKSNSFNLINYIHNKKNNKNFSINSILYIAIITVVYITKDKNKSLVIAGTFLRCHALVLESDVRAVPNLFVVERIAHHEDPREVWAVEAPVDPEVRKCSMHLVQLRTLSTEESKCRLPGQRRLSKRDQRVLLTRDLWTGTPTLIPEQLVGILEPGRGADVALMGYGVEDGSLLF